MERPVRRRLDALIALSSCLLGIALTFMYFHERVNIIFFMVSFFVAVAIGVVALWYVEG